MPQKFLNMEPTGGRTFHPGWLYQRRIRRLCSVSALPSAWFGLARAADSHSARVGKRLLRHLLYAVAANQETFVTGLFLSASAWGPKSRSPAQCRRYDVSAKRRF